MAALLRCCSGASTSPSGYQQAILHWGRLVRGYASEADDKHPLTLNQQLDKYYPGILRHFNDSKSTLAANGAHAATSVLLHH